MGVIIAATAISLTYFYVVLLFAGVDLIQQAAAVGAWGLVAVSISLLSVLTALILALWWAFIGGLIQRMG